MCHLEYIISEQQKRNIWNKDGLRRLLKDKSQCMFSSDFSFQDQCVSHWIIFPYLKGRVKRSHTYFFIVRNYNHNIIQNIRKHTMSREQFLWCRYNSPRLPSSLQHSFCLRYLFVISKLLEFRDWPIMPAIGAGREEDVADWQRQRELNRETSTNKIHVSRGSTFRFFPCMCVLME